MYQIVTIEPGNPYVVEVIESVLNTTQEKIPKPTAGYVIITDDSVEFVGTEASQDFLVIVGHDTQSGFSGELDWAKYKSKLQQSPEEGAEKVFVIAPSGDSTTSLFGYGNFARTVKDAFPTAEVNASYSGVAADTLDGNWVQL